ncbi:serine protease [bacterium]|nr:serine protease [bacterium]
MKAIAILATLIGLCGLASATPQAKTLTAKQIYEKWAKAVVTVKAGTKTGTGFFDDKGNLYTAFHVIRGASSATVVFSDGKEVAVRGLIAAQPTQDIAVLVTGVYAGWENREIGPKLGDYAAVRAGDRLVVIGSPLGLSGSITEGLASGKRTDATGSLLQLSAGISAGSSGSPVFDGAGEVVGMVVSSLESGQLLNFAVSSRDLKFSNGVPLALVASEGPVAPAKLDAATASASLLLNPKPRMSGEIGPVLSGLEALPDVDILVEELADELKSDLTKSDVELWVRGGIPASGPKVVSTAEQFASYSGKRSRSEAEALDREDTLRRGLYLNIFSIKKPDGTLFYFVSLKLSRAGFLSPGRFETVTVWESGNGGYAGRANLPKDVLRKAVNSLVQDFVDAWKAANKSGQDGSSTAQQGDAQAKTTESVGGTSPILNQRELQGRSEPSSTGR